ncbi:hypothetical protein Nepgr_031936 [Nepenthes gracilis]|uniref:Pentatricopeptide repeat-containing protein n=1 Tax=Nepenthes gracilis TaxID=150966 RepID=A0AAD3THN7_NEPGR|nr:hypothetical protein Nepgr_031936 [Nepenthes gracilis]
MPQFKAFSSSRLKQRTRISNLNKARRVLDLVSLKPAVNDSRQRHLRLIEDFLRTYSEQYVKEQSTNDFSFSGSKLRNPFHQGLESSVSERGDRIWMLFELHREGLSVDSAVASNVFSACGLVRSLCFGIQLHCLVVRNGISINIYVGSSLIGFYTKCSELQSACKVFEEMPVRNVVSWTALISGFAREWQIDVCLELFTRMRNSTIEPNDFTFTTILSACTGCGSLRKGRSAHCQTIHLGFDSYVHIGNSLISMYCKCGNINDAFSIFKAMHNKDIISWNSMIAGYALHGFSLQAIGLFEDMRKQKVKPDAITLLGVLSSCRHAGLVDQGRHYFNSMAESGLKPDLGHYSCIVDLLGRAGLLEEARDFILKMPMQPNAIIWGTLMSSCRLHCNLWMGIEAAESRLAIEPACAATHLQLANMYASVGLWDQAAMVRKTMKDREMKTNLGLSCIEIGYQVYRFRAEDSFNPRMDEILVMLSILTDHLIASGYVPEVHEETG